MNQEAEKRLLAFFDDGSRDRVATADELLALAEANDIAHQTFPAATRKRRDTRYHTLPHASLQGGAGGRRRTCVYPTLHAFMNICASMIGSSILCCPFAIAKSGLLLGLILAAMIAVVSDLSLILLV
ncbi:hypothetical protein AAMO2058_001686100, partial [Amorphochlora amoebiformis]